MSTKVYDPQNLRERAIDPRPAMLASGTSVTGAIAAVNRPQASCILIVREEQSIGIFTERDIVRITAREIPLEGVAISEVMTCHQPAISIEQAQDIFRVLTLLKESEISHLPVTDKQGNSIGVLTWESICQILKPADLLQIWRVRKIMSAEVIVAPTNTSVLEIAKYMTTHRQSFIVICTFRYQKLQKPVGIITERDIVKLKAARLDFARTQVPEVMSFSLLSLSVSATLWQVRELTHATALCPPRSGGRRGGIFSRSRHAK